MKHLKQLALTLALLLMAGTAMAALTTEEEQFVGQLLNNKQKLIDLYQRSQQLSDVADGLTNETVPLQLNILRNERTAIIDERDLAIEAVKAQAISDVNDLMSTYEILIDAKEAEIDAKAAELVNP